MSISQQPPPFLKEFALSPLSVSINLEALASNYHTIRASLPPPTQILAIVKADAYGHGAVPVAQTLQQLGAYGFGVASVQEGLELRNNGIHKSILVMGPLQPSHVPDLIEGRLTPVISHEVILAELENHLSSAAIPYPIHLKIDTGLHRLGMDAEQVVSIFHRLTNTNSPLKIEGLLTHFADADNPDPCLTKHQLSKFFELVAQLTAQGFPRPLLHVANSAGILFHPEAHLDLVRPGLMLYGYAPRPSGSGPRPLRPVLQAKTYIGHLRGLQPGEVVGYNALFRTQRPSKIAVLPVGYTHGIPRKLTGKGHVLIQGALAPIIGRICMDMMMVDVTEIPGVEIGQPVQLLGTQGLHTITAETYADWLDTIPYEVLCGIGGKARRTYTPPFFTKEQEGQMP